MSDFIESVSDKGVLETTPDSTVLLIIPLLKKPTPSETLMGASKKLVYYAPYPAEGWALPKAMNGRGWVGCTCHCTM